MSEFFLCEIENIAKSGVEIKVTGTRLKKCDDDCIRTVRTVCFDFSEHDKVFENEIVGLKAKIAIKDMDYKTASELLGKYQQENEALKKRIQELDTIDTMRIDENRELKQRIAELESKETEKPTKINLNDRIKVKLTPLGAEIYYHQYDEVNKKIKENYGTELEPMMPRIDKDGYTEFQLHHFISLYGEHIGICKPNVINPLDIVLVDSHQTHPKAEIGT